MAPVTLLPNSTPSYWNPGSEFWHVLSLVSEPWRWPSSGGWAPMRSDSSVWEEERRTRWRLQLRLRLQLQRGLRACLTCTCALSAAEIFYVAFARTGVTEASTKNWGMKVRRRRRRRGRQIGEGGGLFWLGCGANQANVQLYAQCGWRLMTLHHSLQDLIKSRGGNARYSGEGLTWLIVISEQ